MGLFKKKEKRSAETGEAYFSDSLLTAIIGGGSTVTKEQALQIPTIAACVNLIADRISALPIKLYREEGSEVVEIKDDNRLRLLNHDTGDTINASEMKRLWVRDYFLGKGSYTYIERNIVNEPIGLFAVDEARVAVMTNNDPIHKNYSINVNGKTYFPFQFLKILRNSKGYGTGTSIIKENPLSLAIYYNTMKFENANIRKGGNKRGFLKAASTVGKDEMNTLKESWRQLYSNSDDTKDNIVVLNNGLEFQEASSTSVELQLNENKKSNSIELCKLFCMPADVLCGRADDSTISQFVQNCLMPPINAIEAALDHDLLTEAEKAGNYYFAFDTTELTRGDFTSRMNGYAVALQNNIYQLDEIREKEDLPPLGFNYIKLGLQDVLLDPKTMQIYTPNTKELVSLDGGEVSIGKSDDSIIENRGNPYRNKKGQFDFAPNEVMQEYQENSTPGEGNITFDVGYRADLHKNEIEFANWLHSYYGGEIHMVNESKTDGVKTADYIWNGKLWDLKTVNTEKSANTAIKRGIKQIESNPGGIMLNYGSNNVSIKEVVNTVNKRMRWYKDKHLDVMIICNNEVKTIRRY